MIKQLVKSVLGDKNVAKIQRIRQAVSAARAMWRNTSGTIQSQPDKISVWCLMQVHQIEKALATRRVSYVDTIKYSPIIDKLSSLIASGISSQDFTIKECSAIINAALSQLTGHEDDKAKFSAFVKENDIALDFRGGIEAVPKTEIFSHNDFDFGAFVRSRHSVRRFKDKIISREVINDIVRDAMYCPSACNRQPFRVYFSENPETVKRIVKSIVDGFVSPYVHDALIVTCDRSLLLPHEMDDQEYVNGGIFLAYLVMSIHAHGLGSCLFQFLRVNSRQYSIRKEFGISPSEVISAFVGIGEPEDEVLCACAQRRPVEEVAVCLE